MEIVGNVVGEVASSQIIIFAVSHRAWRFSPLHCREFFPSKKYVKRLPNVIQGSLIRPTLFVKRIISAK